MDKDNKINYTFFSIKALACFCVIMIHCSFPGRLGGLLVTFSRWAVPFFFMLSGYFSYYTSFDKLNTKINQRLKKIVKLTVISFFIYFIANIIVNYIKGSLNTVLYNIKNYKNIFKLVFLNWTTPFIGVGHLWFLLADIYVYIIFKFIGKNNYYKYGYWFSFISMVAIYLVQTFSIILDYTFKEYILEMLFYLHFRFLCWDI